MCPRFSSEDPHLDMSVDTFERIQEAMEYAHTVDFTGWGEPLLHKKIYEMIRKACASSCLTTMTSNGTALTEKNSHALIESGLDRLVVSVDGMRPQTYDAIRIGSSFKKLSSHISLLSTLIEKEAASLQLGIAFTIQEGNSTDLDLIPGWMDAVGARVLHLKHLNVVSCSDDWNSSYLKYVLPPSVQNRDPLRRIEEKILSVVEAAKKKGIRVELHSENPLSSELVGRHCLAAPLDSVYFSYEGRMSPCCHFGHHVSRFFDGEFFPPSSLFFGDIRRQSFLEVWNQDSFQAFRDGFRTGRFPDECSTCYLLYGK